MAASLKATKVMKLDYNIDRADYETFVKACTRKGYAPNIVVAKLIKKFNETGQM